MLTNIDTNYATIVSDEDKELFACSKLVFDRRMAISQIQDRLVISLTNCTTDADCCVIVVAQRQVGAIFVAQNILWCSTGVVYGVYLVKSGVYLPIP